MLVSQPEISGGEGIEGEFIMESMDNDDLQGKAVRAVVERQKVRSESQVACDERVLKDEKIRGFLADITLQMGKIRRAGRQHRALSVLGDILITSVYVRAGEEIDMKAHDAVLLISKASMELGVIFQQNSHHLG